MKPKVILPDGMELDGLRPDENITTELKLFPLGSRFYPGDGWVFYYIHKVKAPNLEVEYAVGNQEDKRR